MRRGEGGVFCSLGNASYIIPFFILKILKNINATINLCKPKKGVYGLLDNQFQVVIAAICGQWTGYLDVPITHPAWAVRLCGYDIPFFLFTLSILQLVFFIFALSMIITNSLLFARFVHPELLAALCLIGHWRKTIDSCMRKSKFNLSLRRWKVKRSSQR